jgi:hypothetical protein
MRRLALSVLCAAALAASAGARTPEARNPVHCSIAFQVTYEIAKEGLGADSVLSRELHGRLVWQALAAARFPKNDDSETEADALRTQFADDSDAVLALTEACMKRQDANPDFREARIEKQVRDGFPDQPLSTRASLAQLKGVYSRADRGGE